jgi:hypothetical protein
MELELELGTSGQMSNQLLQEQDKRHTSRGSQGWLSRGGLVREERRRNLRRWRTKADCCGSLASWGLGGLGEEDMKGDVTGLRRTLAGRGGKSVCRSVSTKREKDTMQTLSKSCRISPEEVIGWNMIYMSKCVLWGGRTVLERFRCWTECREECRI